MRWLVCLLVLVLAAAGGGRASADELRPGYVELRQRDAATWTLGWKQPLVRAGEPQPVVPKVPDNCRIVDGPHRRVAALALVGNAELACSGPIAGGTAGFEDIVGGGDVLLRVVPDTGGVQSYRLTPSSSVVQLQAEAAPGQVWRTYGLIGVEPESLEPRIGLTPVVAAALGEAKDRILTLLASVGAPAIPLSEQEKAERAREGVWRNPL